MPTTEEVNGVDAILFAAIAIALGLIWGMGRIQSGLEEAVPKVVIWKSTTFDYSNLKATRTFWNSAPGDENLDGYECIAVFQTQDGDTEIIYATTVQEPEEA